MNVPVKQYEEILNHKIFKTKKKHSKFEIHAQAALDISMID